MQNYVASIVSLHHFNDFTPLDLSHYTIRQSLSGLRRSREDRPNKRCPITPQMLLKIRSKLHHVPQKVRAPFWAACLFAFTSLLRRSNLLPGKDNSRFLRFSDVECAKFGLLLSIETLKNQRFIASRVKIPISAAKKSALCPVAAFKALRLPPDAPFDMPVFSHVSRKGNITSLNADHFTQLLKRLLKRLGYNPSGYSLHSFRRGGATYAVKVGVSSDELKAQGTWQSECYQQYVTRERELRESYSCRIATHLGVFGRS